MEANAAGFDQELRSPSNGANERLMGMPKDNDLLTKRTINSKPSGSGRTVIGWIRP
jgi:hypothetical protein